MDKNLVINTIKKIDKYVHEIDPLGLGGAAGEYSNVVFNLYKIAQTKNGDINNEDIITSFKNTFGDLADVLNEKDFVRIKDYVKECFCELS